MMEACVCKTATSFPTCSHDRLCVPSLSWQMIVCHQVAACIEKKHRYVVELSAPDRSPFSSMCLQESTFSLDFSFHNGLSRACLGKNDGIFKHKTAPTATCIIIAPKRLKFRLSGSARKSQKRFRDTPMFKFQAVLARTQPFLHAA
jgi:hypothetical protein